MAGDDVVVTGGPSGDAEPNKAERNDEMEEVGDEGERDDGEGLGNALPAARVKRIMRKNPDKKKNFSKDTVLAVSMATVSIDITRTKIRRFFFHACAFACSPCLLCSCLHSLAFAFAVASYLRDVAQELFLDDIVKRSHEYTVTKKRKTMQLADIGVCACLHVHFALG